MNKVSERIALALRVLELMEDDCATPAMIHDPGCHLDNAWERCARCAEMARGALAYRREILRMAKEVAP